MSPLPRTDRMTRALGALTGLDDKLQAVVGYLTDPLGSPVPAVEDRLRLVRAVHDALPTTPDLVLVLTSLSTDRAQAVRRALQGSRGADGRIEDAFPCDFRRTHRPCLPLFRPARHGQDEHGEDPREVAEL